MFRRIMSFKERIKAARQKTLPEEPLGYVFSADQALVGCFRVRALTEKDLGVKNEKVSENFTLIEAAIP